jgi:hypothetical protein
MRILITYILFVLLQLTSSTLVAQPVDAINIEQLRTEIEQLKQDYDAKIKNLEDRLAAAEQQVVNVAQASQAVPVISEAPRSTQRSGNAGFNPAIGVIFEGLAWNFDKDAQGYEIPGFPLAGEAGPVSEGLSLGETEIDISANVDDKFTAWLTAPIVLEDGEPIIEIEEAWIETTALPGGTSLRFGRFFSEIGYLNSKHAHSWDFADQPLSYQVFLGNQYIDDGLQFRWLPPTDLYMELGGELLRGDRFPAGGASNTGVGGYSLFAKAGGDIGDSHSWLAGLSYLNSDSTDRPSGEEDDPLIFNGKTDLLIASLVWKWSPYGNWQQRNLILQTEYLYRSEEGNYTLPDERDLAYNTEQGGLYVQAVYQPFPRWRIGVRYDRLVTDTLGPLFNDTPFATDGTDPERYSIMVDWSNSEFSRIRFQFTQDESVVGPDTQFGLQYIHSIGAHGAHSF